MEPKAFNCSICGSPILVDNCWINMVDVLGAIEEFQITPSVIISKQYLYCSQPCAKKAIDRAYADSDMKVIEVANTGKINHITATIKSSMHVELHGIN